MGDNNGVVLERLSGKKLAILVSILFIIQIAFFLVGGLLFPTSTHTETVEGMMCRDKRSLNQIYYTRNRFGASNDVNCDIIHELKTEDDVIYAFQIPLPRNGQVLQLHRSFQTMTAVLTLNINFDNEEQLNLILNDKNDAVAEQDMELDVHLAFNNDNKVSNFNNNWQTLAKSQIKKKFKCMKEDIYSIDCDFVQLFELGSVYHEYYLINLKFKEKSQFFNKLAASKSETTLMPDVRATLTFIYQTGGFTVMWLSMKTFFFPLLVIVLFWFWQRIVKLDRQSNLIERTLFAVGLSATFLNLPVEWLTFVFDLKWILLYTDIRQGVFYIALFTFWIIFCGEHSIDEDQQQSCRSLKSYWKYVAALWFSSLCLLIFEFCERGMQLSDPFYSVWDSKYTSTLAYVSLLLACLGGVLYFCLIFYFVVKIFLQFKSKQTQLPHMSRLRRLFYEGLIYRFKFLLISTLICVAMTISFAIVNNVNENHWDFDDEKPLLNYTSAFLTGVYAMWNIYVSALMMFYAPSHKRKSTGQQINDEQNGENIEFAQLTASYAAESNATESIITKFATKISAS